MKQVSKSDIESLRSISERLYRIRQRLYSENRDTLLHFGNGSIREQISCAEAALDCILQEFDF